MTKNFTNQKIQKFMAAILIMVLAVFMNPLKTFGAGLLIADGGFGGVLEIKEHKVDVVINNQIAVTKVTQVFHNTERRQVEALYTFPVPKGASVANFSMWINGKEMVGEVLEKERARQIYNSYKRKRRDPGLLEQKDYKTFEMRIFPIGPDADQKVEITYYQELPLDHNQATYVYPLATATRKDINARTSGSFSVNVEIKSAIPIVSLESPSHKQDFVVADHSDTYKQASLEINKGSLAKDVVINYDLERPKTGVDLITSKQAGEDGYFYLTLTSGKEQEKTGLGMDYVFVLDISGSMGNDRKLVISKNLVGAFIDELSPNDKFEVMTFNIKPDTLFGKLKPGTDEIKNQAKTYLDSKKARGGTTLAPAMTTAYQYGNPDRTLNVVLLSDGMTEQAERATLLNLIRSRPENTRVFCIGIGNEVNKRLLEQLAEDSGGLAAFISRGDNFKRQAKAFRRKLMRPVATDLEIEFSGVKIYDVEPARLPNLYYGSQVRVWGRYSGSGQGTITLKGVIEGKEFASSFKLMFPGTDNENPEIERMWAWKRIDGLLKSEKAGAKDVIDEIISLGEEYSIVTKYTSFLVLENDMEYKRWKIERRNLMRIKRDRNAMNALREKLALIRNKAAKDIGPVAFNKKPVMAKKPVIKRQAPSQNMAPLNQSRPSRRVSSPSRQSWNLDFNVGSGPVGPLFFGIAWWLRRKKSKKS